VRNEAISVNAIGFYALASSYFCLDTKVPKNQVIKNASLRAWPTLQIGQNRGCKQLRLGYARSLPTLQQIFAMPCSRTRPPSFCPISPEAVLLTGLRKMK